MARDFVTVKGNNYYVKNGKLDLETSELGITDISEIENLEQLINLQELDLGWNQITEIKGLEQFTNLQTLRLRYNPIKDDERYLVDKRAQEIVRYCQEKSRR
jgi:Leucine-rich repeat (LRR) protein